MKGRSKMPFVSDHEMRELHEALKALPQRTADHIKPIIREAVAAERERCADIADDFKKRWIARGGNIADVSADAANQIAEAIRANS